MPDNDPFGVDPEDLERVLRRAGEQLRSAAAQFGRLFEGAGDRSAWSGLFDEFGHRTRPTAEPETAGAAGDGVWAVYTVDDHGSAHVEQVFATELEALRANSHNTDSRRAVRFLPYGIAVSVLDTTQQPATSAGGEAGEQPPGN